MKPQIKLVATAIWFSILFGVLVIQFVLGGGFTAFGAEMEIRSIPLMLVGLFPLVVAVVGRILVIPAAHSDQAFMVRLIICLALCEAPFFIGLFVMAPDYAAEKAFALFGSVLGLLILFPRTINRNEQSPTRGMGNNPYQR